MTFNVFGGTLNLTQSINSHWLIVNSFFIAMHSIAFHFLSCIVLLYYSLLSFLIFSFLVTISIKLNLNRYAISQASNTA